MDLDKLFLLANNFFYAHTYLSIGIIVFFVIILFLWPQKVLKFLLILIAVLVIGYILYFIGEAVISGVSDKKQLYGK